MASPLPQPRITAPSGELPALATCILIFAGLFLTHASLLRLPYIWDEAGYYVPAARELLLTGSLVPHSTPSNAHPPLVMAWLVLWWKIFGYTPLITRMAMLAIASFALLGVFRLARRVANPQVAVASTICTALYSVFFVQSSLAHLDVAAAAFTIWGIDSYVEDHAGTTALWFSLAALAKETAIIAALALFASRLLCSFLYSRRGESMALCLKHKSSSALLLVPILPLASWFGYHRLRTGYLLGNPEYFRYNVTSTLHPLRIVLAGGARIWQVTGHMHLYFLVLAAALAMIKEPLRDPAGERPRISFGVQFVFLVVVGAYVVSMSVLGGAVLARYMLPALPLIIIVCVSTLWRRVRYWHAVVVVVAVAFVAALFTNPGYGFAFEDNLAYRDYILLHQDAEKFLQDHYANARVLTAWPASDELTQPYLGYVSQPMRIVRIENFSFEPVSAAADYRSHYNLALAFSTKYLPPGSLLARWPLWQQWQARFFGFHRDLPPAVVAQILGGELVYRAQRNGQWIAIVSIEPIVNAHLRK